MRKHLISCAVVLSVVFVGIIAYSNVTHQWVSITSSSMVTVKQIVKSEVDKREGFSTAQEEATNLRTVNDEIAREDSAYKNGIAAAKAEFTKTKNRRDDLTTQFQGKSSEVEELEKDINNLKTGMGNCDSQVARFEQDIKTQQESLKKWLKNEKQGEALVAVIYTRGFKDTKHELDSLADKASAPLMTADMGVYVRSYTKVINNALTEDFIQATIEGTAKWNGEEPVLIELGKGTNGTAYLRVKRYELYPFQESTNGKVKNGGATDKVKVALISSMYDLESFLSQNGYTAANLDLSRMQSMLAEAVQTKKLAGEGLTDQVNSFQEKIAALQEKITNAKGDKEIQGTTLKKKETQLEKLKGAVEALKGKREEAEKAFQSAQAALCEKNRTRETIIVKTVLTTPKGSQTPAEAASESIIDKLEEVKNDARTQHSTSTTTVINAQLMDETSSQAVTEAKITGVKLISFINEGDSVKVKMAFRVKMELGELNQNIGMNDVKEASGFRFAEQTALDTRTGLMWTRNGNIAGEAKTMKWDEAMAYVKRLNLAGYSDWRLPSKDEFETLTKYAGGKPSSFLNDLGFNNVQWYSYWTSSTGEAKTWTLNDGERKTEGAWYVSMGDSKMYTTHKDRDGYVWPVRGGNTLKAAGVTSSMESPSAKQIVEDPGGFRFTEQIAIDKRTGIVWTREGNLIVSKGIDSSDYVKWNEALKYIKKLNKENYAGFSDWRLPKKEEFEVLVKYCESSGYKSDLRICLQKYGFRNVSTDYWTSSTAKSDDVWIAGLLYNRFQYGDKSSHYHVWPVRGGM